MFERPAKKGDIILRCMHTGAPLRTACITVRPAGVHRHATVCREGEAGDNLYVIQSGTFEAVQGPSRRVLFRYEGAGAFGELALMYGGPRAATVLVRCTLHASHLACFLNPQYRPVKLRPDQA
jgi:CRP-like cAMP-binding protein